MFWLQNVDPKLQYCRLDSSIYGPTYGNYYFIEVSIKDFCRYIKEATDIKWPGFRKLLKLTSKSSIRQKPQMPEENPAQISELNSSWCSSEKKWLQKA